jgi:arginine deiminase
MGNNQLHQFFRNILLDSHNLGLLLCFLIQHMFHKSIQQYKLNIYIHKVGSLQIHQEHHNMHLDKYIHFLRRLCFQHKHYIQKWYSLHISSYMVDSQHFVHHHRN